MVRWLHPWLGFPCLLFHPQQSCIFLSWFHFTQAWFLFCHLVFFASELSSCPFSGLRAGCLVEKIVFYLPCQFCPIFPIPQTWIYAHWDSVFCLFVLFFHLQHLGQTLEGSFGDFATDLLHMPKKCGQRVPAIIRGLTLNAGGAEFKSQCLYKIWLLSVNPVLGMETNRSWPMILVKTRSCRFNERPCFKNPRWVIIE